MQIVKEKDEYETRRTIWSQQYSDKSSREKYTVVSHIAPADQSKTAGFDIRKFIKIESGEIIPTKSGVRLPDNIIVDVLEALCKSLNKAQRDELMDRLYGGVQ